MNIEHVRKLGKDERDLYKGPFKALVHMGSWGNKACKAQKEEAVTIAEKNKMDDRGGEEQGGGGAGRREKRYLLSLHQRSPTWTKSYASW